MTYPTYSEQYLLTLTPKQVKGICKNLGIAPHFHKAVCVKRIIEHQATVQPVQPKTNTCKDCVYFRSHDDGTNKGWCLCFDQFVRESHQETPDCILQGQQQEAANAAELRKQDVTVNTIFDMFSEYDLLNYAHQVARDWLALAEKVKGDLLDNYAWRERYSQIRFLVKRLGLCNSEAEESLISVLQAAANDLIVEKMGGVTQPIGEQAEEIVPEPVIKHAENVYRVLSSEGTHRYQVNLYKGTCTCPAGSWYRPCRHIELAKDKQRQETEAQMLNKLPAGWREKQVVHTTPAGTKETQTWFYSSSGHRTNVMPVS